MFSHSVFQIVVTVAIRTLKHADLRRVLDVGVADPRDCRESEIKKH